MPAVGSSRVIGAGPPAKHLTPGEQSLCRKVQIMHRNVTYFLNSQRKSLWEDRCQSCWQIVYGLVVAGNLWFLVSHYTDMKFDQ